ncbi:MAG: APC family permease [Terriglobales bacterium]
MPQPAQLVRAIGRWSLVALVLNSIIGSGVFGLPSVTAKYLGTASPWAYLIAAAGMAAIMACFAEVASRFHEAGGPYLYAQAAFGRFAGIQMGWLAWLVRITALAANANLFVVYLAEFWPQAESPYARALVLALVLGVHAAVNYIGVGAAAGQSNLFIIAKLGVLAIFIAAGAIFLLATRGSPAPAQLSAVGGAGGWLEAVLLLVYAYGGFEAALIPMAEAKDPQRDAPFALFIALTACTLVYTSIQLVVLGTLENAAASSRPLADAARAFLGENGASLVALAALFSLYGYMASAMLNAPRLTFALAERGDFPAFFAAIHPRFHTPYISIAVFYALVLALAVAGSFEWNATLSAVARLFTYGAVCLALLRLRKSETTPPVFRLPAAAAVVTVAIAFCVVVASRMGRLELKIMLVTAAIALINWLFVRRRPQPERSA